MVNVSKLRFECLKKLSLYKGFEYPHPTRLESGHTPDWGQVTRRHVWLSWTLYKDNYFYTQRVTFIPARLERRVFFFFFIRTKDFMGLGVLFGTTSKFPKKKWLFEHQKADFSSSKLLPMCLWCFQKHPYSIHWSPEMLLDTYNGHLGPLEVNQRST